MVGGTEEEEKMSQEPPIRPGITFEIGARLEAQDYLQKWYPSKIEKIDYEEGRMLVHFERWSSRYDEWIHWDSTRIRPLERPALRKEGLREDEENCDFKEGEEVLARWTDCRYYPAKIEAINKEGTYTVQFYDGVIRCLKKMHIKSMPEDAKGQDWIALVKVAAAAAKNKETIKPRTSVNSNRDKDERKVHKSSIKKEEAPVSKPMDLLHKEEMPTSSQNIEITLEDVVKLSPQQREDDLVLKRKMSQTISFQAKRARLNKITGLLASKAVVLDDAEKKAQAAEKPFKLEEASTPKPQTQKQNEVGLCHPGVTVTPTQLSSPVSSGKTRRKKDKREPGDFSGCKKSPISSIDPQLKQGTLLNANLSRPPGRNNRRRSQRTTSTGSSNFSRLPFKDGKVLQGYIHNPQDLSIPKVPDVAFVPQEKLEPLDLSRSAEITTPISLESSFRIDCPTKGKEHLQLINYSTKALADGRIASASSVPKPCAHPLHTNVTLPNNLKPAKASKKKKLPAATSAEGTEKPIPATVEKVEKPPEKLQEKIIKKVNEKEKHPEIGVVKSEKKVKTEDKLSSSGKKKDKDKERKEKKEDKDKERKEKKEDKDKERKEKKEDKDKERKEKKEDKDKERKEKKEDKDKERKEKKEKDHSKLKQKKKKKKKKKSKQQGFDINVEYFNPEDSRTGGGCNEKLASQKDYTEYEDSSLGSSSGPAVLNNTLTVKNTSFQFPRAILSVDLTGENLSDMEFLEDSSTESLILSGDEYNQEFDGINFEESQDEEETISEIVRCVCEMDEENGFMIQCEECLCWQHSVCMGVLEDSIPEQYICYICSDPPGQRWSARYKYDKDWFNNGRMCGLSFINENYSYLNTKKIVSTHHLLADVYGVTEILHGLQLKFGILKEKNHPDLRFWACPMKPRESGQVNDKRSTSSNEKGVGGPNRKSSTNGKTEETYIVSEHSYQKPQSSSQGGKSSNTSAKPDGDGAVLPGSQKTTLQRDTKRTFQEVLERRNDQVTADDRKSGEEQLDSPLQWQLNLLTHIESVQNEVTSRMDLIEKEVDVLESWLDFTGELEPPDPLARLPQLKRRIKQLLTDMGKVQQIATICSV
ncbi:PHD finger protein 20-like protein 1 isoform X2 [Hyperolius riggenbachi]|uniref:PHD finger protein 20-like protein 1 isoform X2 n=1 Tax=Hyperolius riggenbachi TaxID=752182 RepID=UPI0035A3AD25